MTTVTNMPAANNDVNARRAETGGTNASWGIAEFSELFAVTPRTIRHYEDKGLITPRRAAGSRLFTHADYARVEKILRAKRLGFSLDDIREVFDVADGLVKDRAELIRRKDNFAKVIRSLERRRQDIKNTAQEMQVMCDEIEDFIARTPEPAASDPDARVFAHAAAYEAAFAETLSDGDFGGGLSAPRAVETNPHKSNPSKSLQA